MMTRLVDKPVSPSLPTARRESSSRPRAPPETRESASSPWSPWPRRARARARSRPRVARLDRNLPGRRVFSPNPHVSRVRPLVPLSARVPRRASAPRPSPPPPSRASSSPPSPSPPRLRPSARSSSAEEDGPSSTPRAQLDLSRGTPRLHHASPRQGHALRPRSRPRQGHPVPRRPRRALVMASPPPPSLSTPTFRGRHRCLRDPPGRTSRRRGGRRTLWIPSTPVPRTSIYNLELSDTTWWIEHARLRRDGGIVFEVAAACRRRGNRAG